VEIEQPGTELLPLPRQVPSAQPRRRRGLHRHEDLPIPAPHPAALYTQSGPSDELNPVETGKPGLHADLDPFGRTCCGAHRPAPALAGTPKSSCSEEYRRRPAALFIVAAGETRVVSDAVWSGGVEGEKARVLVEGTTGGGGAAPSGP